jgi:hypothetical protein
VTQIEVSEKFLDDERRRYNSFWNEEMRPQRKFENKRKFDLMHATQIEAGVKFLG